MQVGDPFTEKLLIEACLELMATDAIIAIQDMGAAGLTSSTCEMADKGGVGIELDLDHVPQREAGMTAYEMMLSESQERMLMVLKPGARGRGRGASSRSGASTSRSSAQTTDTGRMIVTPQGQGRSRHSGDDARQLGARLRAPVVPDHAAEADPARVGAGAERHPRRRSRP